MTNFCWNYFQINDGHYTNRLHENLNINMIIHLSKLSLLRPPTLGKQFFTLFTPKLWGSCVFNEEYSWSIIQYFTILPQEAGREFM